MNKLLSIAVLMALLVLPCLVNAQEVIDDAVKRAERTQQSVYIVMSVTTTLFVGLFIYLFLVDKKITRLERE